MTKSNHTNNQFKKLDKATFDSNDLTHGYVLDEQKSIEHFGRVLHHIEFLIALNSCINGHIENLENIYLEISNFLHIEEKKAIDDYWEVTLQKLELESNFFCLSFNLGLCINQNSLN